MGYRSEVMLLMYGEPQDCDTICNLFDASDVDADLKRFFTQRKREVIDDGLKYVHWVFHDIKWYDDCERAREKLFMFVEAHENNVDDTNSRRKLAIEMARIGESEDDNEWYGTDYHEYLLSLRRDIEYPNFLDQPKGE
jgi:hypothetical protein